MTDNWPLATEQLVHKCPNVLTSRRFLILGSGPIVIGQSAEFDYSGTQACKALKSEGYEVVLANSNPATIMTDPESADRTYIEPLTLEYLEEIIRIEREMSPGAGFAVLPTVGGQTALNLAIELSDGGVLEKYNVNLIGANVAAIKKAEDRLFFKDAMQKIGLDVPKSALVNNTKDGLEFAGKIGFPVIIRPSFTLGGSGGGIAYNREEMQEVSGSRPRFLSRSRSADRRIGARLEGIRTRGDARHSRQRHHHLLDRKLRPHGRAYRRFDHRGPDPDAHRSRVSSDARRFDRGDPRDRRRDRRIEHSVRSESRNRPHGSDRDESARLAVFGAGVESHWISRSPRSPPNSRSVTRWTRSQRHHAQDSGVLRADTRLRRRKNSEVAVRKISRRGRERSVRR